MNDLKWFILIFIFLWGLWYFTGGPERAYNKYNPFIEEPTGPGTGGTVYNKSGTRY